jgi:SAM-dependent methyltransferase
MILAVSRDEILDAFAPAIRRAVSGHDAKWEAAVARLSKPTPWWRSLLAPKKAKVRTVYEEKWGDRNKVSTRLDLTHGKPGPVVWGSERYFAHSRGTKRVHLLYLMRLIEVLQPKSVLEVGYGMGQNLFILSARFPHISFTGIELTEHGHEVAQAVRSKPILPQEMADFSPLPPVDLSAHQSVVLHVGSAANLPFPEKSFDLVFTMQSLEQMESIRDRALTQIAGVAAGHIAMFEPFADWNTTPLRRHKIKSSDYFSASVSDLPAYGLQPVFSTDDMPSKLVYGIGLVVAKPLESRLSAL